MGTAHLSQEEDARIGRTIIRPWNFHLFFHDDT